VRFTWLRWLMGYRGPHGTAQFVAALGAAAHPGDSASSRDGDGRGDHLERRDERYELLLDFF
jgi:hypothetical protein